MHVLVFAPGLLPAGSLVTWDLFFNTPSWIACTPADLHALFSSRPARVIPHTNYLRGSSYLPHRILLPRFGYFWFIRALGGFNAWLLPVLAEFYLPDRALLPAVLDALYAVLVVTARRMHVSG